MSPNLARRLAIGLGVALISTAIIAPAAGAANAKTKRVSVKGQTVQATDFSSLPSVSADGRFVAFRSAAKNLVGNDLNDREDVFIRDRKKGKTRLVSKRSGGAQGLEASRDPAISANGRYIAFTTRSKLVNKDTNGTLDVYVHDRVTKKTKIVSVKSNGTVKIGDSRAPSISANGRFIAFQSLARLVGKDTTNEEDVYVHDRKTKRTRRVSVKSNGAQADDASTRAAISADGSFIVFTSAAENLVGNDDNAVQDVFVHDRKRGRTRRVSVASNGAELALRSTRADISGDGRFVVFTSEEGIASGDTNGDLDVYVRDRKQGKTRRLSIASDRSQSDEDAYDPRISNNGRWVSFVAEGDEFANADTNGRDDIYVRDRKRGKTRRVSVKTSGSQAVDDHINEHDISNDGRFVVFASNFPFVNSDTNDKGDIYSRGPLH